MILFSGGSALLWVFISVRKWDSPVRKGNFPPHAIRQYVFLMSYFPTFLIFFTLLRSIFPSIFFALSVSVIHHCNLVILLLFFPSSDIGWSPPSISVPEGWRKFFKFFLLPSLFCRLRFRTLVSIEIKVPPPACKRLVAFHIQFFFTNSKQICCKLVNLSFLLWFIMCLLYFELAFIMIKLVMFVMSDDVLTLFWLIFYPDLMTWIQLSWTSNNNSCHYC
jgi:hypothetical protein